MSAQDVRANPVMFTEDARYQNVFAMRTEQIKDSNFNVIAYLDTEDNRSQKLRDSRFNVLGYYDPQRNETRDHSFNIVGYGNLLLTLLCRK